MVVTFNYRYAPKHQKIKEVLLSGAIGKVTSVDFSWYLDIRHGADYFRRWHRLREKSGSLWVHKATHHFDLVNWWLDAEPVEVSAFGSLEPLRQGRARSATPTAARCPHKGECPFYWDITKNERLMALYVDCESADGYLRDGCVFREDVNIPDTMNAVVQVLERRHHELLAQHLHALSRATASPSTAPRGAWRCATTSASPGTPAEETEIHLTRNFGKREKVEIPKAEGGHGGGDDRLRDLIFRKAEVPDHMRLPDSRAGAMSCLTGIAARKSVDEGRVIKIQDLLKG